MSFSLYSTLVCDFVPYLSDTRLLSMTVFVAEQTGTQTGLISTILDGYLQVTARNEDKFRKEKKYNFKRSCQDMS